MTTTENKNLVLFESKQVRRFYDSEKEVWYFSVVDIVQALTDSSNPTDYLKKLRKRDKILGAFLGTNCPQVEMLTHEGKKRKTLGGNVEQLLRLIQSIPSPNAEPFKQWLSKVGHERMQEIADPSQSLNRARENWQKIGRSEKWIQQRMTGQETRNKLTDYWQESGVEKGNEFALLTNIIHQEWTGLTVKKSQRFEGIKIAKSEKPYE
jgi:DNA-damage-inducible protein D